MGEVEKRKKKYRAKGKRLNKLEREREGKG